MKTAVCAVLGLFLAMTACHRDTAPPPTAVTSLIAKAPAPAPAHHAIAACEMKTTRTKPASSGDATVTGADGRSHSLYWIKLDAKTQPARGTLFYLAGGPLSHQMYTDLASTFQAASFPQFDVVLYDYFGFSCSSPIQATASLATEAKSLTTPAMASDFIQLKRTLLGKDRKAFLMGGSYGAMLGAEIVRAYPAEIEKAVLFSGDTASGWLEGGYLRFDRLMSKLDEAHPGFAAGLKRLLESAGRGELRVTLEDQEIVVDRPTFEVAIWLAFGLSSASQAALPDLVKGEDRKWIASVYSVALALLEPVAVAAPPTESSVVTNFYRCNVWFPKSARARRPPSSPQFYAYDSLVHYWDTLCKDYDRFGEFAARPVSAPPTTVPILSWVGDQDTFDPTLTRSRWAALSSNLTFQVMEGWSHDFGPKPATGLPRVTALVKAFYE